MADNAVIYAGGLTALAALLTYAGYLLITTFRELPWSIAAIAAAVILFILAATVMIGTIAGLVGGYRADRAAKQRLTEELTSTDATR